METIIYNCKRCKKGKRAEYPIRKTGGAHYRLDSNGTEIQAGIWIRAIGGGKPTLYGGDVEMGICSECHRIMTYDRLKATLKPDVKCSGICIHARGGTCDCSCGGKNHGKGWSS